MRENITKIGYAPSRPLERFRKEVETKILHKDRWGGMEGFLSDGNWCYVIDDSFKGGDTVEDATEAWIECYNDYAHAHR